ncbi:hypothetical protein JKP88DRAFT_77805 [Tribonema minus]|uniref:Uncharacterized protein n=1 Tax=Tribonema minus TaxID=303371 RepID=A0A835YYI6_9STRA|nr:hypothetical protein JKP88DRAFT_77805 [Tribonema minus]
MSMLTLAAGFQVPAPSHVHSASLAAQTKQDSSDTVSDYAGTGGIAKGIVSGLTNAFNAISPAKEEEVVVKAGKLSPRQLFTGIKEDFVDKRYLWTGLIDDNLYSEDCLFTDPTLSFRGLSTWKKNVGSLRPLVNALVPEFGVDLLSCELNEKEKCVRARWRMWGYIKLPWQPAVDVIGRTRFTYDPAEGNRVVDYFETWELPAGEALMQLVTPGKRRQQ